MKEKNYFCWLSQRVKNTRGATYAQHTRNLCAMLLVLFMGVGQMWGAVYATYSVTDLTNTDLTYEKTGLSGNDQKLNKGERMVEVPCATASGTLYLNGTASNTGRYASIYGSNGTTYDADRQINMTNGYNSTGISFTSADILTDGGKYYIVFGSSADYKIKAFKYTLSAACGGCSAPTDPAISGASAYTEGDNISLTASAAGATSATFTWYKGADWATASAGSAIATGATLTINNCTTSDEGTYWCNISNGTGCEVQVSQAVVVATATPVCPSGLTISGTAAYTEGETISLTAALEAGNGEITYTWYKGSIAAGNEVGTGASFSKASCATSDAGNYFCVASKDACSDAESSAYAVTVDALVACAELVPATSGDAPAAGDAISLTTATGGSMQALSANLTYTANGLQFGTNSGTKASVTLNHLMQETTVISVTLVANGTGARGLKLYDAAGSNQVASLGWSNAENGDEATFTYTVTGTDKLNGTNGFQLWRNNTVTLKSLKVFNCGAELFALTSAIDPVAAEGKATITLSKTLVAAGGTATATYTISDPTAYDFDEWVISGTGATLSDSKANPVTITMGSADAVVTLKLKAASVKHTVTYYDGAEDPANKLGDELVVEGENPTAAEIVVPHKLGYAFAGWSTTDGGAVVALNTISVAADMPLYAVYNAVNCNALSGKIFEVNINVAPAANCTIRSGSGYETSADLIKYGTVSGGIAIAENSSTSNHLIITTTPTVKFAGGNGYVHISFDCALKVGDKIKTTIASQNIAYTTTSSRSTTNYFTKGTDQELTITSGHALENATEIYLWAASSNGGELTSLQVIRPEKFEVTFNMHDHGDAVDPQSVVEGGKVTKPTDPTASGWDFGGWFTDDTYGTTWDFENDVVSAAVELHAKWTAHVASNDVALGTLSVNGEAITIVPSQTVYAVELPFGTTAIPTVAATANDVNAKACTVTQATAVDGSATIYVKAEDNTTEATYTINFSVADHKDLQLVFKTGTTPCVGSASTATQILSNNAAVSTYINQITFTNVEGAGDNGAEGSSLNVGKKAGNMFTLSAKPGFAFQAMNFLAKIQDATCEYSIDGSDWTTLASTNTGGDECYAPFTSGTVHEFRLRSTGAEGVWIRNMQLTIIEACTPITLAWDEEPVEFEVGKAGYAIAATANNGGTISYASADNTVIDVNASTGALTIAGLGSVALSASTPEGDGTTFCENGGADIVISKVVNTYYLVKFDGQNGEAADEVKFYAGDVEVALPASDPLFAGHTFAGWFDAATGGNAVTAAFTPAASMTLYAHWTTDCTAPTIVEHPESANYFTGRTADALECQATAAGGNALTYTWYSCDDELRTNPVELAGVPTPSTAAAGTSYFFCAVTEEGCANVANSNVAVITVSDKDPIYLVKAELAPGSLAASITSTSGYYKDDENIAINIKKDLKLGSTGNYVKVAIDGANFQDGDVVEITLASDKTASAWLQIFTDEGTTMVAEMTSGVSGEHPNYLTISGVPANTKTLYLYRTEAAGGNMNPYPTSMAVYRACAPILNKVTVAGVEGAPDNTNHVAIEVPFSTADAALDAIAYDWISNDAAWTAAHNPAVANAWEWGVENTVTLTDKDNDPSVYYVTISKAAASSDATLSALTVNGQAIALADGIFEYSFELPYGTTIAPTVVATPNHVAAVATVDPCTVNGATITIVPESGAGDQKVYTLTFTISAWKEVAIWDGSYMSAVTTSPDEATGFAWAVNGFGSISSYTTTYGEKSYSKYLPSGGSSTGRYMTLTVPAGYVAKFYVVMASHSDGTERGMFIGSNLVKNPDATSVLELSNNDRDIAVAGMSEVAGAGTWYINPNASIDFQEIRAYLRPGYVRTEMVGNGVLGTICLPNNVEEVQGATLYELAGKNTETGKIVFDEIESGQLAAGAPCMFQAHGDRAVFFYGVASADGPANEGSALKGTFAATTLTELENVYYFAQHALWSCVDLTELSVPANRAWLKMDEIVTASPNPAPGRKRISLGVQGEQVATGLENDGLMNDELIKKVLINGQLFILRGEKMYDATGRLVK